MKPDTTVIERQGNLGGTSRAMGIHADAFAHIMSVLTNLYSDVETAVLREYATNARDSHIAAGIAHRPIEIYLPTGLKNNLEIRDFGIGLSVDDLYEIYSMYGASTKRDSDEFNGVLGLGCKAALSYTNQFTLISVKDGIKAVAVIGLIENGTGEISIMSETETDEDNGVIVQIPAKHGNSFEFKADALFKYWDAGTVLLNGKDPSKKSEWNKLDNSIYFDPSTYEDVVVMGGVPYPITNGSLFDTQGNSRFGTVAFVEMGAVNFTPSRESLHYTNKTVATLKEVREHIKETVHNRVRDEVESAPTAAEAFKVRDKWYLMLGRYHMKNFEIVYNGQEFPTEFQADSFLGWEKTYQRSSYGVHNDGVMTYDTYFANWNKDKCTYVINAPIDSTGFMASYQKGRFSKWAKGESLRAVYLLPNAKVFQSPWLDQSEYKIIDWHTIEWPVVERAARGTVVKSYTVDVYNKDNYYPQPMEVKDLPKNHKILYMPAVDGRAYRGAMRTWLEGQSRVTVVSLRENQIAKFKKHVPKAELCYLYMQRQLEKLWKDAQAHDHKRLGSETRQFLQMFDASRVTSKPMADAFKTMTTADIMPPEVMRYNKALEILGEMRRKLRYEVIGTSTFDIKLRQHYPLLQLMYEYQMREAKRRPVDYKAALDHLYIYINSI